MYWSGRPGTTRNVHGILIAIVVILNVLGGPWGVSADSMGPWVGLRGTQNKRRLFESSGEDREFLGRI